MVAGGGEDVRTAGLASRCEASGKRNGSRASPSCEQIQQCVVTEERRASLACLAQSETSQTASPDPSRDARPSAGAPATRPASSAFMNAGCWVAVVAAAARRSSAAPVHVWLVLAGGQRMAGCSARLPVGLPRGPLPAGTCHRFADARIWRQGDRRGRRSGGARGGQGTGRFST